MCAITTMGTTIMAMPTATRTHTAMITGMLMIMRTSTSMITTIMIMPIITSTDRAVDSATIITATSTITDRA